MSRNITVTFDNGATHTYNNVPDDITPDDVIQRTQRDFGNRKITNIDGGRPESEKPNYLKQFGQAAASLADTVLGAPAAIGQQIGYGVGRAFGLSPEEATAASLKTTQPFMNPVGEAFGVTQTPGYQSEASRAAPAAVIGAVAPPVAQATGLPQQDIESMIGTGMLAAAPAMGRGAAAVGRGVYAAEPAMAAAARAPAALARAPLQFGRGFVEGALNPEYQPATSAMVPLKETYYPQAAVDRYMGRMPGVEPQTLAQLESQARPTSELTGGPMAQAALKTVPRTAAGEPLVPLQGRGVEAWGERVGRGVRTHPLQAMGEIALTSLTGIPFKTIGQGVSEAASRYLGSKAGFSPGFTEQLGQAQTQAAFRPTQLALPAPGPVAPTPTTMYGGAGGVGPNLQQVGQAALQQKYAPQLTPELVAQQAAAAKIPELATGASVRDVAAARIQTPEGQALMAEIRARAEAQKLADLQKRAAASFGSNYRPPVAEQPVAGPVAPTEIPTPPPAPAAPAPTSTLEALKSKLKPMTAEEQAAVDAYQALPPAEKAAQTRAERKSKKNEPKILSMEALEKIQTPYIEGVTVESPETYANIVDKLRNRPYMAGLERSKQRVKSTGEVFTPTPLVDEMLSKLDQQLFRDPTRTFLDPAAGDGQFLSEAVIRKIQNGSTHRQALETTYGVDIMPDNVKMLRERLTAGDPKLMPIAERNLLVGNSLDPFEKVPGQTALDHRRMIEVFGQHYISSLPTTKAGKQKAQDLKIYAKSIGADLNAPN